MALDHARVKSLFLEASDLPSPEERAAYLDRECGGEPEVRARVEALLAVEAGAELVSGPDATGAYQCSSPATLQPTTAVTGARRSTEPDATGRSEPSSSATADTAGANKQDIPAPTGLATAERIPGGTRTTVEEVSPADRPGGILASRVIAGRYTLLEVLGGGGMGTVYRALQNEPVKRQVALKLIKLGMDSRAMLARFNAERQALALMDHPNIARVYDGGTTDAGQPFFVMELVHGVPITEYCDAKRLPVQARLELFISVGQAVQHAHQKGIIHRDLKPSNVLVTEVDGRPAPRVIDFGVAKALEFDLTEQSFGDTGAIVGTPAYMSPEQADPTSMDIDTRTDIYALGVILYELLAGSPPLNPSQFRRGALLEMLRMVREVDPPKPSTKVSNSDALPSIAASRGIEPAQLKRALSGDLDWIVMKALEKDRTRRYETANDFAADILRHLSSEPVLAAPPSQAYRLRKFVRKHRGGVIAASLVLLTLLGGIAGTTWGWYEARRSARAERRAKLDAQNQQARAEERETQAIDAVKRFRDAVADDPALKTNPDLEALRKRLLKEPLAFFKNLRDRLQADKDTRPESLNGLASAAFELGTLTNEIGDMQDALIAHREALAIWRKLADANPSDTDLQSSLAASHHKIGRLLRATGEADEALKSCESALAIQQKLVDTNPTISRFQSDLATSHFSIGYLLRATGKPAAAMKSYESALAARQRLADANPTVTEFQYDLADSHFGIAILLTETGQPTRAMNEHETALAIFQKLSDANPTITRFQVMLAESHRAIGQELLTTGKPADARRAYDRALEIRRILADSNPAVTDFQFGLAAIYNSIGVLLRTTSKPAEAMKAFEAALAIERKLADAYPTVVDYQRYVAGMYKNIGTSLAATGKAGEALEVHQRALDILRKLARANPTVTDMQFEVAESYGKIAILLRMSGKQAEAIKAFESALEILRKLTREHPASSDFASVLGGALSDRALVDLEAKRYQEVRVWLREAIVCQRKALAAYPANSRYRQFLTNHLIILRAAAQGLGDSVGVAEAERELAKLHESDPATAALDTRLTAIVKGAEQPRDEADRLALAQRAYDRALHATAARLWAEAISANPKLADRTATHRYNAACSATLAGCGQSKDNPAPNEPSRAKLRKQAHDWLKVELVDWSKHLEGGPKAGPLVAEALAHWKTDTDLAGIRDKKELAKLPEGERSAFQQLWSDVDRLLAKARAGGRPERRSG